MANPERTMARMQVVGKVSPIEGADRIERAKVGGWEVVIAKGSFHDGDYVVFYEPDTFMPVDDPRYAFLAERGNVKQMEVEGKPVTGHVLRTSRLRGVYSQGLALDPHEVIPDVPEEHYADLYRNKVRLDKMVGVCEYDPGIVMSAEFIGPYDPAIGPQTDAERIQNVEEDVFDLIKRTDYFASVKVDGSSTSMVYDPRHSRVRVFSHRRELDPTKGIGKAMWQAAEAKGLQAWCAEHPGITLQMELLGPKFNCNRLGFKENRLMLFSMWDMANCRYLDPYAYFVAENLHVRPLGLDLDEFQTTDMLIEFIDGLRGHTVKDRLDEGVVVHVMGPGDLTDEEYDKVRDALGQTMQMKVISRAYLAKAKE